MNKSKRVKKFKVPHVYVILLSIVLLCGILTYIVPAGEYLMEENAQGRSVLAPDSFHYTEGNPIGIFGLLRSVPQGMAETAEIIFFIFIVGGSFSVLEATKAVESGLGKVTQAMAGREKALVPIIMFIFGVGGGVFGMAEETLPFIPIMVTLAIALGFDSLTGIGIVLAGAGAGFAGAFMNPFTVGVAQGIAGLPLFSGMKFRLIVFSVMMITAIAYVYWYGNKVKKNPEKSIVYEFDKTREDTLDLDNLREFTTRDKGVLLTLAATMGLLVFGVVEYGWYIQEISALFLGMAMVVAIIGKLGFNGFAEELVKGMSNLAGGALVVGFARAILVVLTDGMILHTILNSAATLVSTLPSSLTALGMYVFQIFLNFIIPSGSGQAAVSIPILAPLSDLVGVTRQTAVLAYQFGDGISNILTPTSGYFMAGLALAKIPWNKWARWFFPLFLIEFVIGGVLVFIAHMIQFGPF